MGNGYTELFFLDEVAALAAGHRPCFECRRAAANSFANHWERAVGALVASRADEMGAVLHDERIEPPRTVQGEELDRLPEGAFIESGDKFYAKRNNLFWLWSGNGYSAPGAMITDASLITPPSILKVLTSGYEPVWHVSIG